MYIGLKKRSKDNWNCWSSSSTMWIPETDFILSGLNIGCWWLYPLGYTTSLRVHS